MIHPTEYQDILCHRPRPISGMLVVLLAYGTLLALAVAGWAGYAAGQPSVTAYAYRYDFVSLYGGARLVATGQSAALFDLQAQARAMDAATAPYSHPLPLPYVTPGWVALVLAPLALLPFPVAFLLWAAGNLSIVAWTTWRWVRATLPPGPGRLALGLMLAGAMPVLLNLLLGQIALWPLLGITEAWFALQAGRERRAGLWLLLGLAKPHLILLPLLALLLTGRWRVVGWFALGAAGVGAGSLLVLGNWVLGFFALTAGAVGQGAALGDYPLAMHNWRAMVLITTGQEQPALVGLLTVGSLAALVGLARRAPLAVAFAASLLLGLLVSPHFYLHDAVLALPAGCLLWQASAAWDRGSLVRSLLIAGPGVAWLAQFGPLGAGASYLAVLTITAGALAFPPSAPRR